MMKIKTTMWFKARRLADYTGNAVPEASHRLKDWLNVKWHTLQGDKLEREIFNSCIILKNLAIVHKELPMSADFILEQLMGSSKALKHVYADILTAYRSGKGEAAFEQLYLQVPLKSAKSLSHILCRLDRINPAELITHMNVFEDTFSAERKTKAMARAERKSLITTLAATATIFAVLLNFTMVVVFMDTLKLLEQIF